MDCCQLIEHSAANAKVTGSSPVQAIHFGVGLMILVSSFQLRILSDSVIQLSPVQTLALITECSSCQKATGTFM